MGPGGAGVPRPPQKLVGSELLVDPLHPGVGFPERILGSGNRGEFGDLDPDVGVLGEGQQFLELRSGIFHGQIDLGEMIDTDLHFRMAAHRLFQLGELSSGNIEVEDRTQLGGLLPEPVRVGMVEPSVAPLGAVEVVDRAETHSREAMLLDPILQPVGHAGIGGVDEAMGPKTVRVCLEAVRHVGVVPAVVDHLHQDAVGHAVAVHVLDEHLGGAFGGNVGVFKVGNVGVRKGIADRIVCPDVHVRVDDREPRRSPPLLGTASRSQHRTGPTQRCRTAPGGFQKLAPVDRLHRIAAAHFPSPA